ncbi:hypothetical protein [Streptomyces albiflavescens]|uniref:hypothetical protein n=1 Tax=Streptomyces albiflavescens TaxID=1623582 RepID=UPI00166AFA3B|nr:hypothetical protein [Streptomyces albiflavescens]
MRPNSPLSAVRPNSPLSAVRSCSALTSYGAVIPRKVVGRGRTQRCFSTRTPAPRRRTGVETGHDPGCAGEEVHARAQHLPRAHPFLAEQETHVDPGRAEDLQLGERPARRVRHADPVQQDAAPTQSQQRALLACGR